MERRPAKIVRLNFVQKNSPFLAVMADPGEVRMAASEKSFISVKEDGITISPSVPGKLNLQGLPGVIKYGGMLQDIPFPLGLLPAPFLPKQIFVPPLGELLPTIRDLSLLTSMFAGV